MDEIKSLADAVLRSHGSQRHCAKFDGLLTRNLRLNALQKFLAIGEAEDRSPLPAQLNHWQTTAEDACNTASEARRTLIRRWQQIPRDDPNLPNLSVDNRYREQEATGGKVITTILDGVESGKVTAENIDRIFDILERGESTGPSVWRG